MRHSKLVLFIFPFLALLLTSCGVTFSFSNSSSDSGSDSSSEVSSSEDHSSFETSSSESNSSEIITPISLDVTMLKTNFVLNSAINPDSDIKVVVEYSNSSHKTVNYDANGLHGWYFSSFLNPNGEKMSPTSPLNMVGEYVFSIVYEEDETNLSYDDGSIIVLDETTEITKQSVKYTYQDYSDNCAYNTPAFPSIGSSAQLLVVPVWLSDSSNYIPSFEKELVRAQIETAYFGSKGGDELGWHSVKSYYEENSYGKLHINGTVTDWYESSYSSYINQTETTQLVIEVADWYKQQVGLEEYKKFDGNGDGYLDALILIYGAYNYANDNSNLWAYCYWVQDGNLRNIDNPGPNTYFWASFDFLYKNQYYPNSHLDAHTYIHEMGHVLGLTDYYDYNDDIGNSPAAGFSMQDCNVGGHDPFSKMALGWVDPYVPTTDSLITVNSFQESGDIIVLSPNFTGSPFDEYLMLELYTPTGLNEFDCTYAYSGNYPKGPTISGIRLWHVDARMRMIVEYNDAYYYSSDYYSSFETVSSTAGFLLSMSNTTYGGGADSYAAALEEDRNFDLLALVRNKDANDAAMNKTLSAASLFQQGDTFSMSEYSSSFPNGTKLNSGLDLGFSFEILELNDTSATIRFNKL